MAEGDVVAVVESMKMETSLTAPFAGRVRRVLSRHQRAGPGAHAAAAAGGDRGRGRRGLRRARRRSRRPSRRRTATAAAIERLRWALLGYDVSGDEVRRALAVLRECDTDITAAEHQLLDVFTDVRALTPRPPRRSRARAAAHPAGVPARVPALARREGRAAPGALRDACSSARSRTTASTSLDRTPALEDACYRLFVSQERADLARAAVMAILEKRLERADELRRRRSTASSAACSTGWSSRPSAATR